MKWKSKYFILKKEIFQLQKNSNNFKIKNQKSKNFQFQSCKFQHFWFLKSKIKIENHKSEILNFKSKILKRNFKKKFFEFSNFDSKIIRFEISDFWNLKF